MDIRTKRAYETPARDDGVRILVDGIYPRGVSKEDLAIETWLKDVAPSDTLRRWFNHDPEKWDEFRQRYFQELREHPQAWEPILEFAADSPVTLVYGAKNEEHNNAVALKEFLEARS